MTYVTSKIKSTTWFLADFFQNQQKINNKSGGDANVISTNLKPSVVGGRSGNASPEMQHFNRDGDDDDDDGI